MASYRELIKDFEKLRAYMREFYVYGFKSRSDYSFAAPRSYDDMRRRIESWLGDYMRFTRLPAGKSMFLSVDSRAVAHNPLYRAWKAKSFTDGDITLHFIIFDILHDPLVKMTLSELTESIDRDYLSEFDDPSVYDESTVRKKLSEYVREGIIVAQKQGRRIVYSRAAVPDSALPPDALDFYSETAPCGVVGSFILDKKPPRESIFSFKHHYITRTPDSDVLALLFDAMQEKRTVTFVNSSRRSAPKTVTAVPLRILESAVNGRIHLVASPLSGKPLRSYRVDYISDVHAGEVCPVFDALRSILDRREPHMWGVNTGNSRGSTGRVEFTVAVGKDEEYIIRRMESEKRCGTVEQLDEGRFRFSADLCDPSEIIPWVRTFICRITDVSFSDREAERVFLRDLDAMYDQYGIGTEED